MSDIFISHANSAPLARQIADALRALGYQVWWDDEVPVHREFLDVINEHLLDAKAVVVLWTNDAVKSPWVRGEAEIARKAGKLVQLSVDGTVPPLPFNAIQYAQLKDWRGDTDAPGWRKAVDSVAQLVRGDRPATASAAQVVDAGGPSAANTRKRILAAALVALVAVAATTDRKSVV